MDKIISYLMATLGQTQTAAERNARKLLKYEDIQKEFEQWMETKQYPDDGVVVEGYNAKTISELAAFMNEAGVYNFLVTLRDNPAFGLQCIKDGFPRK